MIAALNPHIVSRLARHGRQHDVPLRLTTEEQEAFDANVEHCADALLRFDNVERYTAQSKATKAGALAPLPPRHFLPLIASPAPAGNPSPLAQAGARLATSSTDKDTTA